MEIMTEAYYKAVFSNVDGTVLTSSHKVSPLTKDTIIKLQLHGIPFVFVSGRSPRALEQVDALIGLTAPYICYYGGLVLDQNKRVLKSEGFQPKKAIAIKNYIKRCFPDVCCVACSYDTWIADDVTNPWIRREAAIIQSVPVVKTLSSYLQSEQQVHKLLCLGETEHLNAVGDDLRICFPELSVFTTKEHYLEIMPREITTSGAIRLICGLYGIDPSEAVSFGFNMRDIDMFQTVGCSAAVGNAAAPVKAAADFVTPDNDHDGVFFGLKKLFPSFF